MPYPCFGAEEKPSPQTQAELGRVGKLWAQLVKHQGYGRDCTAQCAGRLPLSLLKGSLLCHLWSENKWWERGEGMDGKGGLADLLSEATAHLAEASSAQFLRPVCTQVSEQTACKSHY